MLQWFSSYAKALEAGGPDCLYQLKVPSVHEAPGAGTHGKTGQIVPCITHFGLKGPKRTVSGGTPQTRLMQPLKA